MLYAEDQRISRANESQDTNIRYEINGTLLSNKFNQSHPLGMITAR